MGSRILIADDDSLVRMAIQKILNMFNHDVVAVQSGREVLEQVSDAFDVIVLDINMPDMDGFETLERLNRNRVDIPVLFLTGAGSMEYAVKAIHLGAYDFLTKPIMDIELFHIKVKQAAEKNQFLRQEKEYKRNWRARFSSRPGNWPRKISSWRNTATISKNATVQIMSSLQAAMEEKDGYTAGHTRRVTEYALQLGQAAGLTSRTLLFCDGPPNSTISANWSSIFPAFKSPGH
jgi:putative two-component system response regulator